ncbi:unnamed protein product, partial [Amoebophrya sp. A25]
EPLPSGQAESSASAANANAGILNKDGTSSAAHGSTVPPLPYELPKLPSSYYDNVNIPELQARLAQQDEDGGLLYPDDGVAGRQNLDSGMNNPFGSGNSFADLYGNAENMNNMNALYGD